MKKIVIGASIGLVVVAAAVVAVLLLRRSQLAPEDVTPPPVVVPPDTTIPEDGTGATGTSELPPGITVGLATPGSLPEDAIEEAEVTVYPPGLNRAMTAEEKEPYGWGAADVWIRTTRGADGQTEVEFYNPSAPVPPPDADSDGLSDADEAKYGTDPRNPDADGDQLKDGLEIRLGSDPKKADTNGDGVSDYLEFERSGKVTTDGDGDVVETGQ